MVASKMILFAWIGGGIGLENVAHRVLTYRKCPQLSFMGRRLTINFLVVQLGSLRSIYQDVILVVWSKVLTVNYRPIIVKMGQVV